TGVQTCALPILGGLIIFNPFSQGCFPGGLAIPAKRRGGRHRGRIRCLRSMMLTKVVFAGFLQFSNRREFKRCFLWSDATSSADRIYCPRSPLLVTSSATTHIAIVTCALSS